MKSIRQSKAAGIIIITAVYLAASALGIHICDMLHYEMWLKLLIADCAATVFVYIFSALLRNASVYDPYWSVQPIVILAVCAVRQGRLSSAGIVLLALVAVWGVRLTANWAYTFGGLDHQDWRYAMLSEKTGIFYPVVNLLGIHMFPTLVVYLCVLPGVYLIQSGKPVNFLSIYGIFISAVGIGLETAADIQMHRFRKSGKGGLIRDGLWHNARHPNYLGEIMMWWGVALQAVLTVQGKRGLWMAAGAMVNMLMFRFISIPMAEKRQSLKPGWDEYFDSTNGLMPFPRKSV